MAGTSCDNKKARVMTMKLELAPEVQAGLLAQAQASGLSLEEYAEKVLRERAEETMVADCPNEPFWKSFTRQVHALPDDVFERLPEDGASEHDHYLYGAPKRNG
jgi:hypothetical protein